MSDWRRVRLDWVSNERRQSVDAVSLGADEVFHYSIPALDELGDGRLEAAADIGSNKLSLRGGEVLVSKLNPRISRVLIAEAHDAPTMSSTEFIALQPTDDLDRRFACYWLESDRTRQYLDGATMSVTRSQQRVRPELLTKSWIDLPPLATQRAIADFLDAETARIDALIAKKRRLATLSAERERTLIERTLLTEASGSVPLRRLLETPPQYGASESGELGEDGWPRYIRITDLKMDGSVTDTDILRCRRRLRDRSFSVTTTCSLPEAGRPLERPSGTAQEWNQPVLLGI